MVLMEEHCAIDSTTREEKKKKKLAATMAVELFNVRERLATEQTVHSWIGSQSDTPLISKKMRKEEEEKIPHTTRSMLIPSSVLRGLPPPSLLGRASYFQKGDELTVEAAASAHATSAHATSASAASVHATSASATSQCQLLLSVCYISAADSMRAISTSLGSVVHHETESWDMHLVREYLQRTR